MRPENDTISATILTQDCESIIERCLESVKWVDEIVIVDAFSKDKTAQIAKRYTDKVFQRPWRGFVDQRNFSLSKAQGTWILWVDSDEVVSDELKGEIRQAVCIADDEVVGFEIPRCTFHLGRWIRHGGWYPDYSIRLFRRVTGRWVGEEPHAKVQVHGRLGRLKNPIWHYSYESFSHQIQVIDRYSSAAAQDMKKRGRRTSLWRMLIHPLGRFAKDYVIKRGFLDGMPGLIITVSTMFYVFAKYAKLWELDSTRSDVNNEGRPGNRSV